MIEAGGSELPTTAELAPARIGWGWPPLPFRGGHGRRSWRSSSCGGAVAAAVVGAVASWVGSKIFASTASTAEAVWWCFDSWP